jgi:methylmalonyl-CoA mutase N-terminal domain/subunit
MEPKKSTSKAEWLESASKAKTTGEKFTSLSGRKLDICYTPEDVKETDYYNELSYPGEFPYTRGIHYNMYRGRLWTMRQFAGFGTPEDTNQRFKYLLTHGQTGLSTAFDMPTLMGWDSDSPLAEGEVGICGVSISSLEDMEILFDKIPLDQVSTSMTINSPAMVMFAFYLAVAEKQGVPFSKLRGTLQNDILKEYIAQNIRIIPAIIEYSTNELPQFNPVSASGYHIREAGSTAAQELAFTLADGFAYIEDCIKRGLDVDSFAPRISYFFNAHLDFFEEIAKYRAARRIFAKRMKNKYGAKNEKSMKLRFHSQTAGCSLTAQQPENNIVRTTIEALAAVLGGTQSLHTNSMDETLALPSDKAVKIALRTQQVIAQEHGVANVADPLGGSYFVEKLTDDLEAEAEKYFEMIDSQGGVVACIENGFFQREIADAAYRYQLEIDKKEKIVVGINDYIEDDEKIDIPILNIPKEVEEHQVKRLKEMKASRNQDDVNKSLEELIKSAHDGSNIMPRVLECSRKYVTLGEMCNKLKEVFGVYEEQAVF